jgi:enoyl-CoA hydratase/carnithine racemase
VARTLGNCLSISVYARLATLIGPAHVKDLVFTARLVEGPEAKAIGLVTELVEDHAALGPRAEALARQVAGHAPLTLRATKEALRRLRPQPSREGRGCGLHAVAGGGVAFWPADRYVPATGAKARTGSGKRWTSAISRSSRT